MTLDYVRDDEMPQRRAIASLEAVTGIRNPLSKCDPKAYAGFGSLWPQAYLARHDLSCIRPIGDVNDSVFPLPLFLTI